MRHAMWLGALALVGAGCFSPYQGYDFEGRVYDGVSGQQITSYSLSLQYGATTSNASVNSSDGRYTVGTLPPFQDFTISITAMGYRTFLSHNGSFGDPGTKISNSLYYDAYLYPTSVTTTATTFNISGTESMGALSGQATFKPATSSDLLANSRPAIAGQVWQNSADLQLAAKQYTFSNGTLSVPAGDLIYGVSYSLSIYGVAGYEEFDTVYKAGVDGMQSYVLNKVANTGLQLAYNSAANGTPEPSASLVLVFNQPIELDPNLTNATVTDALNVGFSIVSPDANANGMTNTLNAAPKKGVAFSISNSVLTLTWSPSTGLATTDTGDPIVSATYGGLNALVLRPVNGRSGTGASVASLVGANQVTVIVSPL